METPEYRLLGEILTDLGYATPGHVDEARRKQVQDYRSSLLGELLMEMGVVTREQVVEALKLQANRTGGNFGRASPV